MQSNRMPAAAQAGGRSPAFLSAHRLSTANGSRVTQGAPLSRAGNTASLVGLQDVRSLRRPRGAVALSAMNVPRDMDNADSIDSAFRRADQQSGNGETALNTLPAFEALTPQALAERVADGIGVCEQTMAKALSHPIPTWDNLIQPCMEAEEQLSKDFQALSHLDGVQGSPEVQKAYGEALAKMTEYGVSVGQNTQLYEAVSALKASPQYASLDSAQQRMIDNKIRDFELSGIHLPAADKKRLAEISQALSEKSTQFSKNVLTATQSWTKSVKDPAQLKGVPAPVMAFLAETAKEKGKPGYMLTLDGPVYQQLMTHLDNRDLRETLYKAYMTRASAPSTLLPPFGKKAPDNTPVIQDILKLRQEKAELLGFKNHAEVSLSTKMAETPEQIIDFMKSMLSVAKPQAEKNIATLTEFANNRDGIKTLAPWDIAFYSEQLKQSEFDVSQDDFRPYFPVDQVLDGLINVVEKLHDVKLVPRKDVQVWDSAVRYYDVTDKSGARKGGLYMDLYARPGKRGGAWMDVVHNRMRSASGDLQLPVANLVCNFMADKSGHGAQLTPDEVRTLFHETGHSLHHLLTEVDYPEVGGINGVAWDAVELPSQLMENWGRHPETIPLLTRHETTGEALPEQLQEKLLNTENFHSGVGLVRQIELSLFDLYAHLAQEKTDKVDTKAVLEAVKKDTALVKSPKNMAFENAFSHVFAGGYDAGYYSYLWAKVLAADVFSRFDDEGIFNVETSQDLRDKILSQGGVKDADVLFRDFMGREPDKDAMLKQMGLLPTNKD